AEDEREEEEQDERRRLQDLETAERLRGFDDALAERLLAEGADAEAEDGDQPGGERRHPVAADDQPESAGEEQRPRGDRDPQTRVKGQNEPAEADQDEAGRRQAADEQPAGRAPPRTERRESGA